jgi:hypothetical protein
VLLLLLLQLPWPCCLLLHDPVLGFRWTQQRLCTQHSTAQHSKTCFVPACVASSTRHGQHREQSQL